MAARFLMTFAYQLQPFQLIGDPDCAAEAKKMGRGGGPPPGPNDPVTLRFASGLRAHQVRRHAVVGVCERYLGLKFDSTKGAVEVWVIESIEPPTPE